MAANVGPGKYIPKSNTLFVYKLQIIIKIIIDIKKGRAKRWVYNPKIDCFCTIHNLIINNIVRLKMCTRKMS